MYNTIGEQLGKFSSQAARYGWQWWHMRWCRTYFQFIPPYEAWMHYDYYKRKLYTAFFNSSKQNWGKMWALSWFLLVLILYACSKSSYCSKNYYNIHPNNIFYGLCTSYVYSLPHGDKKNCRKFPLQIIFNFFSRKPCFHLPRRFFHQFDVNFKNPSWKAHETSVYLFNVLNTSNAIIQFHGNIVVKQLCCMSIKRTPDRITSGKKHLMQKNKSLRNLSHVSYVPWQDT